MHTHVHMHVHMMHMHAVKRCTRGHVRTDLLKDELGLEALHLRQIGAAVRVPTQRHAAESALDLR